MGGGHLPSIPYLSHALYGAQFKITAWISFFFRCFQFSLEDHVKRLPHPTSSTNDKLFGHHPESGNTKSKIEWMKQKHTSGSCVLQHWNSSRDISCLKTRRKEKQHPIIYRYIETRVWLASFDFNDFQFFVVPFNQVVGKKMIRKWKFAGHRFTLRSLEQDNKQTKEWREYEKEKRFSIEVNDEIENLAIYLESMVTLSFQVIGFIGEWLCVININFNVGQPLEGGRISHWYLKDLCIKGALAWLHLSQPDSSVYENRTGKRNGLRLVTECVKAKKEDNPNIMDMNGEIPLAVSWFNISLRAYLFTRRIQLFI